jgi:hypothetical protein
VEPPTVASTYETGESVSSPRYREPRADVHFVTVASAQGYSRLPSGSRSRTGADAYPRSMTTMLAVILGVLLLGLVLGRADAANERFQRTFSESWD